MGEKVETKENKENKENKEDEIVQIKKKDLEGIVNQNSAILRFIDTLKKSKLGAKNKIKNIKEQSEGEKKAEELKKKYPDLNKDWREIIGREKAVVIRWDLLLGKAKRQTKKSALWITVRMNDGNRVFKKEISPTEINTFNYKSGTYMVMKDRVIMDGKNPTLSYIKGWPCPLIFSKEGIGYAPEDNLVNNHIVTSQELHSALNDNALRKVTEDAAKTEQAYWLTIGCLFAAAGALYFSYLNHGIIRLDLQGLRASIESLKPIIEAQSDQIQNMVVQVIQSIPR